MVFSNSISEQRNLHYLNRIQTSVELLSQSLDEVLIISRVQEPTGLDLDKLCRNLVAEIRAIATQLEKQATLQQCYATQSQPIPESLSTDTAKPTDPRLSQVFQFIEANYHQPITLDDVAQAVGYSPAYLTDLMRRQTGQPVYQWIVERRMAVACSLLLETDQSVEKIAQSVGYRYTGCFFRQFRQSFGTTPKVWRKENRIQASAM